MNWRVGVSLVVLALEGCAILYICLPIGRKRTSGPWLIAAGVVGAALGAAAYSHLNPLSETRLPLPFDPNDDVAWSIFGEWILLLNFLLGAGIPFLALAIRALAQRKGKEVSKVD